MVTVFPSFEIVFDSSSIFPTNRHKNMIQAMTVVKQQFCPKRKSLGTLPLIRPEGDDF
jgi:hypothetical protein